VWQAAGLSRAERVIRFIEGLPITSGIHAGRRFVLRDWQRTIVRAWYRTDRAGHRLVRQGLLSMGKKNGKTSLCAALVVTHLVGPEVERRGQIVAAASDRDQSSLIFDEVVAFLLARREFANRVNIQRHSKIIEDLQSGTKFRALSSDAAKAHGMSPSVIVVDELAQWGTGAGRDLYTALTTATGARAEPLTLVISTQTADPNNLMSELVDYGKEVNAGRIVDPTFSAHLFEVPLDAPDIWDERVWPLANPALGDFRSLEEFRVFADRAKQTPGLVAAYRQYYLNQRITAEAHWLDLQKWDACAEPVDRAALRGRRCFVGVDLSATTDLTAVVALFPGEDGVDVLCDFWLPADNLPLREQRDHVPFTVWARQGLLRTTDGNVVELGAIERRLHELVEVDGFDVVAIGIDPWAGKALVAKLQGDGLPAVEVPQSMSNLSSPAKELERLVLAGRLRHGGHPILRWHASNVVVDVDGNGNIRPSKRKSTARIDGISATVTALSRVRSPETAPPSVYETRGVLTL
jgi:phage terminase large subunit-like protein